MLVGRTGLSPVMVGRATEFDRLVGLVGAGTTPHVALVAGEAGIGKTRLVQELITAMPPGALTLAGQADPGTVGRPMELFLDALRDTAASAVAEGSTDGGDGGPADLLAAVRDPDRAADERVRSAVDLVRRLTAGLVGLVVFEDLHWADSESVQVFERLAEPDMGRLLLVGTYRPDALSRRHPAAEMLPRLDRRHRVTHVRLQRLSPADVSSFLIAVHGGQPSFRVVEALHTRTGGHPFFLEELVAAAGEAPDADIDDMPLPWTVAELVRSQLDDVTPDVRRMVTTAAVLGRRVPFDLLAAVTKASEDDLIERLRAAVDAGLLVEAEPDVFGFHHEIAREAIEGGLLGRERRRLHEAALAALQGSGSQDYVSIVHHARAAGRYDEMVEAARVGAHESLARGSTFQALQLAEAGLDEAEDDLDLLSVAARAAWLADILDDTVPLVARWLELARERAGAGEVAAALSLSMRVAFEMGDLEAMAAFTDQLMATVDDVPDPGDRGRAMATIAQSWMLREHVAETTAWADRALALAEEHGLDDVRIAAMVEKGSMLSYSTQQDPEAYAYLRAAAEEAERAGQNLLAARAYSNLVWNARGWRDADEGRALVDRMVARAEAAGFGAATADRSMVLAQIAATEGDLDRARAHLEEMDEPAHRRAGLAKGRWMAVLRAGLALEAGDLEAAERYTAAAKPATERTRSGVTGLDMHLAIRHGDLAAARRHLADLVEAAEAEGSASIGQAHDLMSVGLPAGLTAAEMRPLVALAGYYAGHRLAPGDPWRCLLEAQLAENEGRVEEAADGYARAAVDLGRSLNVLAGRRGSAHVGAARMLVALGRLDDARAHVRLAQPLLARWRSWRVAELRAVERRLGLGDEPSGPEALTPREREVAALLAQGLTNAQLADRLFISPRTAAVHVSNILAKLGMGSRTEVAAWAASGGLAPTADA